MMKQYILWSDAALLRTIRQLMNGQGGTVTVA